MNTMLKHGAGLIIRLAPGLSRVFFGRIRYFYYLVAKLCYLQIFFL